MAFWRARVDGRAVMSVGAHQTIGHLVHLALADEPRAGRKQRRDDGRIDLCGRMARREFRMAIGRDLACDVDVLLDDKGEAGKRAALAPFHVERDAQRAKIIRH